mmetsp:Transcript_49703/g.124952  ORF Transcript_49703/g.124952 Transcript_49703/m.124952 type:complete len:103 (-) Transcript_49703:104-412(-)
MLFCYGFFGPLLHDDVDRGSYMEMGGISFALVILNIVCIYIMGIFTFWVKAIAPLKTSSVDYYKEHQRENEIGETYTFQLDPEAQERLEKLHNKDDDEMTTF